MAVCLNVPIQVYDTDTDTHQTKNSSFTHEDLVQTIETEIQVGFKSVWLQSPARWTFFGSMFFCCTVFTTVGYGEIYPVTLTGKLVCVLYAMVGIPLMLLVISDVGDILAVLLSKAYTNFHLLCRKLFYRTWSPRKAHHKLQDQGHGGTFVVSHEVEIREPTDVRQALPCQVSVSRKVSDLRANTEIFDRIIARDHLVKQAPMVRSFSCPELDKMAPLSTAYTFLEFEGIGNTMDQLDVPMLLILVVVVAYIVLGGLILPIWETDFEKFDPYYFCFITLTTIGFGDIVPKHPKYFMLISVFIITGMAIMSMSFKLGQSRIVTCYRQCMRFISRGNTYEFEK
ncbi:potassium channel subfamily K member 18 [Aplochiton taeniatus]